MKSLNKFSVGLLIASSLAFGAVQAGEPTGGTTSDVRSFDESGMSTYDQGYAAGKNDAGNEYTYQCLPGDDTIADAFEDPEVWTCRAVYAGDGTDIRTYPLTPTPATKAQKKKYEDSRDKTGAVMIKCVCTSNKGGSKTKGPRATGTIDNAVGYCEGRADEMNEKEAEKPKKEEKKEDCEKK
jgi:hypothetical protein